jgi:tetratricopeptide (TPR) repeat protein
MRRQRTSWIVAALLACASAPAGARVPDQVRNAKGAAVSPRAPTILSTALVVARKASVARMKREGNLTWASLQLRALTQLYARAGRFDDAVKLIDNFKQSDDVKVEAFVPIVVEAIRRGDAARAAALTKRVATIAAWPTPGALAEIAIAMHRAGDRSGALRIASQVCDPAALANTYVVLGQLEEALAVALSMPAERVYIPISADEEDSSWPGPGGGFSLRHGILLRLVAAFADRRELGHAHAAMEELSSTPTYTLHLQRAFALLEIARVESPAATLRAALQEVDSCPARSMLGDVLDESNLYAEIAERFEAAGEHSAALESVHKAAAALGAGGAGGDGDVAGAGTDLASTALVRVARAERALGLREQARDCLERALREADAISIQPADSSSSAMAWDSRASSQYERVEAKLRVAAELERAGEADHAARVLDGALIELAGISTAQWRGYAWHSLLDAYRAAGRLDRGLELLASGPPANPDKKVALPGVRRAELLAGPRQRLWKLLAALAPSYEKAALASKLAVELEARGEHEESSRMVAVGLSTVAAQPEEWALAMIVLAGEAPGTDRPVGEEQAKELKGILKSLAHPDAASPRPDLAGVNGQTGE